ncbi:MAG: hypothetical protein KAS67_01230, partial [Thermoplasmata archaeon]|nr:hypothetical protein [Thermoplasmata archaeon]
VNDVAWNTAGTLALVVGTDSNANGQNAAWYYPDVNTWTYLTNYPYAAGYTLNACEWCEFLGFFYMVGEARGGSNTAFFINPGDRFTVYELQTGPGSPTNAMSDIAVDIFGNGLAVGANDQVYFFWNNGGSWSTVSDGDDALPAGDYCDVGWESAYQRFYIVGETTGGGSAMITFTDQIPDPITVPSWHYNYLPAELGNYPELYSIAWNNDPNLPIADRYALVGGNDVLVGIKPVDLGGQFYAGTSYPLGYYDYIAWDESTWNEATIISNRGGISTLYQFMNSSKNVVLLDTLGAGDQFTAVDYRMPQSPGWGFVVGNVAGYQLNTNAFHSDTTVTVKSDMPHIFDVQMWKQSDGIFSGTKFNTQVNVATTYTFYAEVNYTVGGANELFDGTDNVRVYLEAFYDEGIATSNPEPTWATTYNRTRQFSFLWEEGGGGPPESAAMIYPIGSPGTDEFQLVSWWRDPGVYGGDGFTYRFFFNVSFGDQTWAADGNNFVNGAPTNPHDDTLAWNDLNSWNVGMMIFDNDYNDASNASHEEFGIWQSANITVSGNPSGNAPPGVSNQLLGTGSQITCSANIPYYVNVSIPDLARIGGGLPLSATDVKVRSTSTLATDVNSEIRNMQPFPGAKQNLSVWGNTSQALFSDWVVPAPKNGTTAHGPWGSDYNGYLTTDLEWYVTIPGGTAEGIYQATITFRIGFY